jgi:DNA-binding transcriptional MerR regulator
MHPAKEPKVQYSESDAAQILGVSVDQLRILVKNHIVKEEEVGNGTVSIFQPADLLVLRILSGMSSQGTAAN